MNSLKGGDTIPYGVHSGKRLRDVVKKYGRKVLLEIVKFNEVDDDYLKKYHYHHPATEEEIKAWELKKRQMVQEETYVSAPVEDVYETDVTEVFAEEYQDQDVAMEDASWDSVLYDPEDDPDDANNISPYISVLYEEYTRRNSRITNL